MADVLTEKIPPGSFYKPGMAFGAGRYTVYVLIVFSVLARAGVQDWAVAVVHILTLLALFLFLADRIWGWEWQRIKSPLDLPLLLLGLLVITTTIFSVHRATSLRAMMLFFNYAVVYYLVLAMVQTRARLRHLVFFLVVLAVFLALIGLFQTLGNIHFPWWQYPDLPGKSGILKATFGNRNHMAGFLAMIIPMQLGLFLTGRGRGRNALLAYFACVLIGALVLTLSRGGWLGTAVGLIFMTLTLLADQHYEHKKALGSILAISVFVIFVVLANTAVVKRINTVRETAGDPSIQSRLQVWHKTTDMIHDRPWLGHGPGTFALVFTQYQPPGNNRRFYYAHNDYLQVTSTIGILGLPLMAWLVIALYRRGFRKMKNSSRLIRGTTAGAMAGITAILVHGLMDFNLHIPANALIFTTLAAIIAAPIPRRDTKKATARFA
jgi:O-antigen ligase